MLRMLFLFFIPYNYRKARMVQSVILDKQIYLGKRKANEKNLKYQHLPMHLEKFLLISKVCKTLQQTPLINLFHAVASFSTP